MRWLVSGLVTAVVAGMMTGVAVGASPAGAGTDPGPALTLAVAGTGVALRPAFDPSVARYGIATTSGTAGAVTVDAASSEPEATVRINGVVAAGPTTVSGLSGGEEISVVVDDSSGRHAYGLVYLPSNFPEIVEVAAPAQGVVSDGAVLLTMRTFALAVDEHGVPLLMRDFGRPTSDLKPAPHGHYTVMVLRTGGITDGDWDLLELDERFETVATSHAVAPLTTTDNHDAIVTPDGTRYLVGYEPDESGDIDPTIQQIDPAGHEVYTWDGGDHLARNESTAGGSPDWAHINSIQLLPGGDILASFRHLSAVMRIAWSDGVGHQRGDVVWRLGGRLNDFAFPDDAYGGTCAQHTASVLQNGHVLVYDNGSSALGSTPSYCVDPADRAGATVDRPFTRVIEYAIDESTRTATVVHDWRPGGRYSYFAGSARRLANGHTLVDWASDTAALVSELDDDGQVIWELQAPQGGAPGSSIDLSLISYRAEKADVPDRIAPTAELVLPRGGAYEVGDVAAPAVRCADRGGSILQSCSLSGGIDTAVPGVRSVRLSAVDGAGNTTVTTRTYRVVAPRGVLAVRTARGWRTSATLHLPRNGASRRAVVRVTNDGLLVRRATLRAMGPGPAYRVRYWWAGRDITAAVRAGSWRTPALAPGSAVRVVVRVTRVRRAGARDRSVRMRSALLGRSGSGSAIGLVLRRR